MVHLLEFWTLFDASWFVGWMGKSLLPIFKLPCFHYYLAQQLSIFHPLVQNRWIFIYLQSGHTSFRSFVRPDSSSSVITCINDACCLLVKCINPCSFKKKKFAFSSCSANLRIFRLLLKTFLRQKILSVAEVFVQYMNNFYHNFFFSTGQFLTVLDITFELETSKNNSV